MNDNQAVFAVLKDLGLKYRNEDLYITAFTHQSYANEHNVKSNERLEYLGDAVLNFLVAEFLYRNFPDMPEGELTKMRAKYVCATANSLYAQSLKLNKAVLLGRGESEQGGREKSSVLGDLFEAFLGALFLDGGLNEVKKILKNVVFPQIENPDTIFFTDYKSRLQEFIQSESRQGVEYNLDREIGPPHNKTFYVSVSHNGIKLGTGKGKTKKDAEQQAAKYALKKLVKN